MHRVSKVYNALFNARSRNRYFGTICSTRTVVSIKLFSSFKLIFNCHSCACKRRMSINDQLKRLSKELSSVSKRVVTMHSCDMPRPMMLRVIQSANDALDKSLVEGKVAQEIQTKFQEWYPEGPWHVIVGRDFGSYVTHDEGKFMYFSLGTMIILLFMSKEK